MAKRQRHRRRQPVPTVDYADAEGNVLSLRQSLSAGTIAKIGEAPAGVASSLDDAWRLLFAHSGSNPPPSIKAPLAGADPRD